jgi:hypothetical protein
VGLFQRHCTGWRAGPALSQRQRHDPSTDEDLDDSHGEKADDDNDYSEDHVNPENNRYHDRDDASIVAYGHAASAGEKQAITAVAKRYYMVAVMGDGAKACSMLVPSLAKSIPQDYAQATGPSYLRGNQTCQAVMSTLFQQSHIQLTNPITVTGVRVDGKHAFALLGSSTTPASVLSLEREGGTWKVGQLLGAAMP